MKEAQSQPRRLMMTLYQLALFLATGFGTLYALIHVEREYQVYYDASSSNVWQPTLFSEFYLYSTIGILLFLVFILQGFSLGRHLHLARTSTTSGAIEKRNYVAVILLITLLAVWAFFPAHATVSGIQNGRPLDVSNPLLSRKLEMLSIRLLVSCDYEAKKDIATEARWQQALEKSHVDLIFGNSRTFAFPHMSSKKSPTLADEILIPIAHRHIPDYALVRFNGQIRAFTRYSCDALTDLQKLLPADALR